MAAAMVVAVVPTVLVAMALGACLQQVALLRRVALSRRVALPRPLVVVVAMGMVAATVKVVVALMVGRSRTAHTGC